MPMRRAVSLGDRLGGGNSFRMSFSLELRLPTLPFYENCGLSGFARASVTGITRGCLNHN